MSTPKPLGRLTRGKTAPHRLRQTDAFLIVTYPEFIRHLPGLYVDLGYGRSPLTTYETYQRLRRMNPSLQTIGVEIDPRRVADAQPFARPGLEFRHGGFNLPLRPGEIAAVIRTFNVLRQYDEAEVADALATLNASLIEGGLILEGTCDPPGRLLTFNLYQKQKGDLRRIAFVFAPRLSELRPDFDPRLFRAVLPKNFIHHAEPGGAIDRFFAAWGAAWSEARGYSSDPRRIFAASARTLAERYGYALDRRSILLRRGLLSFGPAWPSMTILDRGRQTAVSGRPSAVQPARLTNWVCRPHPSPASADTPE